MSLPLNLLEYLEKSYIRCPEKTAFSDEAESFTFSRLRDTAMALGTRLACLSDCVSRPVAVFTDRTASSAAMLIGALYGGHYYVPIDTAMPETRMQEIMAQITPTAVMCMEKDADRAASFGFRTVIYEDAVTSPADKELVFSRIVRVLDIDPAYVIFTSGSTGTPKGIVVSHRSVIDFAEWMADYCGMDENCVMGNQAPFYFDLSVKDLWLTIKLGATAHILPKKLFMFPKLLIEVLNEKKITNLNWATSAFNLVASSGILKKQVPQYVKRVVLGGETLYAKNLNVWRNALPDTVFINLYGPTEVTVDCTAYTVTRDFTDGESVPIGRACRNMEVMLLDDDLRPVKKGETGEICVRGSGVSRGYYGDPEKTSRVFVQNPMCPWYPDIIYRTGDMGYEDEDGNIVFATRSDGQIKHVGYRIELGEVERAVNSIECIDGAVCFFDAEKDRIVCAYKGDCTSAEIIGEIKRTLPRYMFPNIYIKLDELPYNANGKTDRVKIRNDYENSKD